MAGHDPVPAGTAHKGGGEQINRGTSVGALFSGRTYMKIQKVWEKYKDKVCEIPRSNIKGANHAAAAKTSLMTRLRSLTGIWSREAMMKWLVRFADRTITKNSQVHRSLQRRLTYQDE